MAFTKGKDDIVKLLDDYTSKLKELFDEYLKSNKNRFVFLVGLLLIQTVAFLIGLLYFSNPEMNQLIVKIALYILIVITTLLLANRFIFGFSPKNKYKIEDEIKQMSKALLNVIELASQYRTPSVNVNIIAAFEIDLKLTEAEDIISHINKIPALRLKNENENEKKANHL